MYIYKKYITQRQKINNINNNNNWPIWLNYDITFHTKAYFNRIVNSLNDAVQTNDAKNSMD